MPFLAPLFAAQFLTADRRPLALSQALGMVVLIMVVGQALAVATGLLGDRPLALLPLLWLLFFACFLMQGANRGGAAVFLVLVMAIIVPLLGILQRDLGGSIILILVKAVITGAILSWLAHAAFPDPAGSTAPTTAAPVALATPWRAVASAFILLGALVLCLVDSRLSTAIVIPITVASLLGQLDLATSGRTALGLVIVNLFGGIVASFAYVVLSLDPTLWWLFLIVLVVGLLFGGSAAGHEKTGKVYAGALTIFLILFGLGVSPLPGTAAESFSTRIAYVLFAITYALCAAALFWPRRHPVPSANPR